MKARIGEGEAHLREVVVVDLAERQAVRRFPSGGEGPIGLAYHVTNTGTTAPRGQPPADDPRGNSVSITRA